MTSKLINMLPELQSAIIHQFEKVNASELTGLFLDNQDLKKKSKETYSRTLRIYFNWLESRSYHIDEVSRSTILEYKESLLQAGMSSLTVGSYITAVRKIYEWLESNKLYPNVAKGIRSPHRKQQFRKQALTPLQGMTLLSKSQEDALSAFLKDKGLRDFAIINLLIRTGLRTIEVIRANIEDITFKGGKRVLLVHGKGRDEKDDFVVLTDKAFKPIETYLSTRKLAKISEPLFVAVGNKSRGCRLVTRTISRIAKEALKAIGLDDRTFTAHSLRHTTAVNILRAGGSLETAQSVLRHASPVTTQIYTYSLKEEMRLRNSGEELLDDIL